MKNMKKKRLKYEKPQVADLNHNIVINQAQGAPACSEGGVPAGCVSGSAISPT